MAIDLLMNPVTGERIEVLESTPARFRARYALGPHSAIPGAHFHPGKQQRIEVQSGLMHVRVNGAIHAIGAGESFTIPTGASHYQWNETDVDTVAIEEISPAGRMHQFFAVLFQLARDGRTDSRGLPPPLIAAVLFHEFRDSIRHASWTMRMVMSALVPFGIAFGYRRMLGRHLDGRQLDQRR